MNYTLIGIGIFILSVIIIELALYAFKHTRSANRVKVRKRLRKYVYSQNGPESSDIVRKRILSDIPFLNHFLWLFPPVRNLDLLIQQANSAYSLGFFVLMTLFLAVTGFLISTFRSQPIPICILAATIPATIPYLYLTQLKQQRINKFRRQLPEGLDLIARALKAGHAFTSGMKLAADEFNDPLGPEFDETLDEINFGVSVSNALKNLARRVDCPELKYFVVAVILQRETGGNLAEIIESLSYLIRERFKLQGKIKTLAAEGKLSAIVLTALPFLIVVWLQISNPDYLNILVEDPVGRIMVLFASIMLLFGIIVMKKMINIKV